MRKLAKYSFGKSSSCPRGVSRAKGEEVVIDVLRVLWEEVAGESEAFQDQTGLRMF